MSTIASLNSAVELRQSTHGTLVIASDKLRYRIYALCGAVHNKANRIRMRECGGKLQLRIAQHMSHGTQRVTRQLVCNIQHATWHKGPAASARPPWVGALVSA